MNKSELIKCVASKLKDTEVNVERIVNCVVDQMKKALRRGELVQIYGFGSFRRKLIKARRSWNGHPVPANYRIYFRTGAGIKGIRVKPSLQDEP